MTKRANTCATHLPCTVKRKNLLTLSDYVNRTNTLSSWIHLETVQKSPDSLSGRNPKTPLHNQAKSSKGSSKNSTDKPDGKSAFYLTKLILRSTIKSRYATVLSHTKRRAPTGPDYQQSWSPPSRLHTKISSTETTTRNQKTSRHLAGKTESEGIKGFYLPEKHSCFSFLLLNKTPLLSKRGFCFILCL